MIGKGGVAYVSLYRITTSAMHSLRTDYSSVTAGGKEAPGGVGRHSAFEEFADSLGEKARTAGDARFTGIEEALDNEPYVVWPLSGTCDGQEKEMKKRRIERLMENDKTNS